MKEKYIYLGLGIVIGYLLKCVNSLCNIRKFDAELLKEIQDELNKKED